MQAKLKISLPKSIHAHIAPHSGLVVKKFIVVGVRVIDSDYRGEHGVVLFKHSAVDFLVQVGDRIAQSILEKVNPPEVQQVKTMVSTSRGVGGFGSTRI